MSCSGKAQAAENSALHADVGIFLGARTYVEHVEGLRVDALIARGRGASNAIAIS